MQLWTILYVCKTCFRKETVTWDEANYGARPELANMAPRCCENAMSWKRAAHRPSSAAGPPVGPAIVMGEVEITTGFGKEKVHRSHLR